MRKRSDSTEAATTQALTEALAADPGSRGLCNRWSWNEAGDLALVQATLTTSPATRSVLRRDRTVAQRRDSGDVPSQDGPVYVSGQTAGNVDFIEMTDTWTPRVFLFVLGLSFLLLMVAFRSIVVPATAIVMNLLSVGAAYGVLVLVFQQGHLTGLLGFSQTPVIEAWIPIFLFCVSLGSRWTTRFSC